SAAPDPPIVKPQAIVAPPVASPPVASKPPATPVAKPPAPQAARKGAPLAVPAAPAAPLTLDLNALEAQLRATKAIGVFTKISLKNKVDDLMKQFREHY